MRSRLIVESDELDTAEIASHLQLKGVLDNDRWQFESAERLKSRDGDSHAQYWIALLDRHKDGKNHLIGLGYRFTLEFDNADIELHVESLQGIGNHRVSVRLNAT